MWVPQCPLVAYCAELKDLFPLGLTLSHLGRSLDSLSLRWSTTFHYLWWLPLLVSQWKAGLSR